MARTCLCLLKNCTLGSMCQKILAGFSTQMESAHCFSICTDVTALQYLNQSDELNYLISTSPSTETGNQLLVNQNKLGKTAN